MSGTSLGYMTSHKPMFILFEPFFINYLEVSGATGTYHISVDILSDTNIIKLPLTGYTTQTNVIKSNPNKTQTIMPGIKLSVIGKTKKLFYIPEIMPSRSKDPTSKVPLFILGAVCFITVFMCQTRFKIAKEIKPEVTPPLLKSHYISMIYGFGKPDRFRLVLRTFVVITSPLLAFASTGLLLFGKTKSNPYLFLPWLFVALRGLLFIQTDNLFGILKALFSRYDQTYAFCLEDWKWSCLYFTIFFFTIAESFAVYEVYYIFQSLWSNQYNEKLEEPLKFEPSDLEKMSTTSLGTISSVCSKIGEYHTITSICKFGLLSDQPCEKSPSKLTSLVALFCKEH